MLRNAMKLISAVLVWGLMVWGCSSNEKGNPSHVPNPAKGLDRVSEVTTGTLESNLVPQAITIVDFHAEW